MSGPQCCENPPTLSSTAGTGHVEKLAGFDCYFTGSADSKLAILLVADLYGYESPNLRKLADRVASAGYYVVIPDFLYGDPYDPTNAARPLPVWSKAHPVGKGFEDAKPVVEALKAKGVNQIGAAGFCWGAKVAVELGKINYIGAAVLLHPTFVVLDDIKAINNTPIAILGAEFDKMCPPELTKQFEEVLTAKPEVDSFVKIFPGVSHGWAMRYTVQDEVFKSAMEAHDDMLGWFTKYIK